jgi:hypothetical protein
VLELAKESHPGQAPFAWLPEEEIELVVALGGDVLERLI